MTKNEILLNNLKKTVADYFIDLGIKSPEIGFDVPVLEEHGDFSCISVLKYAKILKKNPKEVAVEVINLLNNKKIEEIKEIKFVSPGYIDIFLNGNYTKAVLEDVLYLKGDYGRSNNLKNQTWVIEHTSPNPNKAMHLGHLRNNLVGMNIANLLEFNGAKVICDAVDNNRGIAIAKLMWGFLSHMKKTKSSPTNIDYWHDNKSKWYNPTELKMMPDKFVSKCYILGEEDFKASKATEEEVRSFVVKWENNDKKVRELWAHVLEFSYQGIYRTLDRIGNRWDSVWHEHEHYQEGKKYVEEGLNKGIFRRLDDGAILTNLSKYELSDTILLKSDGTSLYITQDIALTAIKKKKYSADKLIWVIGPEQSLAMKQMFAVCEQLGIGKLSDFTHISYGYVGLKTKDGYQKMSSRKGTVVLINELIDLAKNKISQKLSDDSNKKEESDVIAEKMALAAVKFSLLKVERSQDVAFDIEKAVDMQGDTGVYLLYTYARINSILRKAKFDDLTIEPTESEIANRVVKKLAIFNSVIERSLNDYSSHHLSQYLLKVASEFNKWYGEEKILDASENQAHKLSIAESVSVVIKNGLTLLGIKIVEEI